MAIEASRAPLRQGTRLPGVDVARALAIIGMFLVHISPSGTGSPFAYVLALPRGRSAILFGLLAGVGVSLLAASPATSTSSVRATLLWRAAVLLPLGLHLQGWDHDVFVILADHALLFVLGAVVVRWRDRWLLALAGASLTLGSLGYLVGAIGSPATFDRSPARWGMGVFETLETLVATGPYPLLTWAAPFCLGVWLGRCDLTSRQIRWRMVRLGGAAALSIPLLSFGLTGVAGVTDPAVGWWQLLADVPHSQTPLWLLSASASAVAILGLALLLADRLPTALAPLTAAGRLAFTWYVAHLLALHLVADSLRTGTIGGTVLVTTLFTLVIATASPLWLSIASRGPLEYTLRPPRRPGGRAPREGR